MRGARNVMRDNVKREMQSSADLFTFHASRITFHVSPITFHVSRITLPFILWQPQASAESWDQ